MSKKKVEKKEIKPIFNDLETQSWWYYKEYTQQQITEIEDFFTNFAVELKEYLSTTKDFRLAIEMLSKSMGVYHHPIFNEINISQKECKKQNSIIDELQSPTTTQQQSIIPPQQNPPTQLQLQQTSQQQQAQSQTPSQTSQTLQKLEEAKVVRVIYDESQNEKEKKEEKKNYVIFQNAKLDLLTLRQIQYIWSIFDEYTVMKFANNCFNDKILTNLFNWISTGQNRMVKLFFDWNPLPQEIGLNCIPLLGSSNLEFLILRSCQINDVIIEGLFKAILANPNSNIRHLELYDNQITAKGIQVIGQSMLDYQKIEYLSLAKNNITSFDWINPIIDNIGKFVLNEQDLAQYREKEKEKEELINQAKKKKKKIEEIELPKLLPLVDQGDGTFAYVKNQQLKMINLAMNPFNEEDKDNVEKFLSNLPDDFQLVLVHSNFETKTKDKMKKRFKKKIII